MTAVSATGLRKAYRHRTVLDGVDLHVGPGQVVGLLGPNGAGKTTIVKALLGMVHLDSGSATVLGHPAGDPASRRALGYLPEQFQYPGWLDGRQVLETHARLLGLPASERDDAIADALRLVGLAGRGDERVSGYSKGMQQRLGLATAVLGRPELVILDEPTSALDPIGRREVRDLIRALRDRGTAVLLNSHLLGEVEQVCDHVVILHHGRVLRSGPLEGLDAGAEVRVGLVRMDDEAIAVLEGFGRIAARDGDTALVALDDVTAVPALAAFMAVLLASGAVAPEIDSGRLHAILARPISRTAWLAQRAATFAGLSALYIAAMSGVVLAIARGVAGYQPVAPGRAIGLLVLEVVVLVALGAALSVRLSAIAAGVVVIALYGAAWIAGIMELIGSIVGNDTLERIGVGVSLVIPSDGLWRAASYYLQSPAYLAITGVGDVDAVPFAGSAGPSPLFVCWSVAYVAVWWLLADRWFRRRDL